MPNAINPIVAAAFTALTLSACQKANDDQQNILVDTNVPANAEFEALPPDESSATPTNELMDGADNADVNDAEANAAANQD